MSAALGTASAARAQNLPDTVEAIDRARVTTRILYVTAHPDDESSRVLTYLARGLGADVALLSITRGEGGQNAIGPEQGAQLGAIRSEELFAATQIFGVRLFFTRAPDLGFVKTVEKTQQIWAGTALPDLVRVIRTFRPTVVINNWGGVHGGHGHHQTSGIITPQAVAAAADASQFPEQLTEGLAPWRTNLVLEYDREDNPRGLRIPVDEISPLWGRSYREIGQEGSLHHRSQGIISGVIGNPFFRRAAYFKATDGSALEMQRLAESIITLAGDSSKDRGVLESVDRSLIAAREASLKLDWPAAARSLAAAGTAVDGLRETSRGDGSANSSVLLWELDRVKERIDTALALASGLRIHAEADRREIVAGESFGITLGSEYREHTLDQVGKPELLLPAGWRIAKQKDSDGSSGFEVTLPAGATPTPSPDSWMYPRPAPLVRAEVSARAGGYSFTVKGPAVFTRATSTDVTIEPLTLVPAATLALDPVQFLVVENHPPRQLEIVARVHYYGSRPAEVAVGIDVPAGWRLSATAPIKFDGPDDRLVRFSLTLPEKVPAGSYPLGAIGRLGEKEFRSSVEPLPSLPARLWTEPAVAAVRVLDLVVPEKMRVGYVAAENDPIPEILRQVGIQVEMLDPAALAFSDLSRFDAIAVGIRAYELRGDLARANQRLLDYAAAGGTLVVQYQRSSDWQRLKPAPFPATVGSPTVRITDENSPVRFALPEHPLLNFPNRIGAEDFKGWVQERGLYFFSDFDARYEAPLAMRDPGEQDVTGGLVYARSGKGVYIYTGLSFFRQLPEGVPGAVRLFVNLLSPSRNK